VFLDEVGSMPVTLQAKLLRVLQEREIERIGDEKTIEVDVRVVAATNQPLSSLVSRGEFRDDLYYRLNVVPIHLPPLRDRTGDIPLLVRHFAHKYAGGADVRLTAAAVSAMEQYTWPGNVRELENFCERVILMRSRDTINEKAVRAALEALEGERPSSSRAVATTLPEMERQAIVEALEAAGGNQSRAARMLGIPRHVLLYRLKKFGIDASGGNKKR
jgi:transcriptional regulator with GAF, ATPase, and Fis domain